MSAHLAPWSRKYFQEPGGKPFLFYAVFGAFPRMPALCRYNWVTAQQAFGIQRNGVSRQARSRFPERPSAPCSEHCAV
jgi:hypothetical protein